MAYILTSSKTKNFNTGKLLSAVLREIHLLRREISFVLPQEDIKDYFHPSRVKPSYQKAIKKYPPSVI